MDAEEYQWFKSLEMPAVRETARQDGLREVFRTMKKYQAEQFNLKMIKQLREKGEKLAAIHYVLDLDRREVCDILLSMEMGSEDPMQPMKYTVPELVLRMHKNGRSIDEIRDLIRFSEDEILAIIQNEDQKS